MKKGGDKEKKGKEKKGGDKEKKGKEKKEETKRRKCAEALHRLAPTGFFFTTFKPSDCCAAAFSLKDVNLTSVPRTPLALTHPS